MNMLGVPKYTVNNVVPLATLFVMGQVYPGTLTPIWFSLLSLCPDGQRWICVG
jgi:hypothetical protein